MKDLIVVTNMNDDTKATLTVTKLTQAIDQLCINAYPFQIPRKEMAVGQCIKAKHYADPDFKLSHTYQGTILSIEQGKRIVSIRLQLNNDVQPEKKTLFRRIQGVLRSRQK